MLHARPDAGFTLVEVVISMLLVAIMTVSFMPILLTGTMTRGRIDRRSAAASSIRRASETLKAFVTADRALARGPGTGADGWSLVGDLSGRSALEAGHHDLEPTLWSSELATVGGAVSYDVTVRDTPSGPQPTVSFSVSWVEP